MTVGPGTTSDGRVEQQGVVRPGRGPYRKGVERRSAIVRSATQVFAERGYHGASLRTIGERVGVSSASLVQYFGTKEGLLAAVLEEWARESRPAGIDGLRGLDWIRSMREAMLFNADHPGLIELFLTLTAEATSPDHPARPFVQQRYAAVVAEHVVHLREAVADGEVAAMGDAQLRQEARLFVAAMDGIELQWLLDPAVDLLELFDRLLAQTLSRWAP
ncbi:TetR/AcrR family transcriptional regulator [Microlunatus flavus]|uniref:DNA-binding transcriptional regulator, AcrR family n=1 Tax=Microlunatus flavus TaxID=1036181 RepID=A0A1H8ZFG5_9ACTN|nr:TetR/AcrR family transcriptional regulator [Microlunatus flavus]SEP63160.1 DNA-binding transcriptional regulator, AcrR family [Microlunatus flavus]